LHATSDFATAQKLYEKALKKSPKDAEILTFNAINLIALNDLKEALKSINLALKISPENFLLLYNAGRVYYALKEFEQAKSFLTKAVELFPSIENKNLLALTYFELGEWEKANEIFLELLKENELNINLLLNSAKCYEKLSDKKSAKAQLEKLLVHFPEMEEAVEMMGKLK